MTSLRDAQVQELIAQNERLLAALRHTVWALEDYPNLGQASRIAFIKNAKELIAQAEEKGR
jgi:hypothetical protein